MPRRPGPLRVALLLVALLCAASCIKERRYLIMADEGRPLGPAHGAVAVGEVAGEAHYRQLLTLFANGNLQGVQGTLLSDANQSPLEERLSIPLLDPVLARLSSILSGSTRVGTAQRVAMGRAILAAQELGADTLLAPRVEIVTRSLDFLIPLGWIYSTGAVEVKAHAVRLGRDDDDGTR